MSTQRWPWPDCELHERIGEGGIADVFRATLRGREVALKVLRDTESPGLRARFLREGKLLSGLDHPGIVRCHEVFDTEPPAIALELLHGEALDTRVERTGGLRPDEATHLAATLLRALAHLHAHGIVHRDVKPGNVFLTEGNRTVLLDLGLAADAEDPLGITLGEVIGTWAYMAPEQVAGAETDHRVDLYGLGVTLYHALAGALPFEAQGLAAWLEAHRRGGATPLATRVAGVPPHVSALVDRLMARDPTARPATATVALAELTGRVAARPTLLDPPTLGREGIRGAILAVIHTGGLLRVDGELGSGLGEVARQARALAREEGCPCFTVRCRRRTTLATLQEALLGDLGASDDAPAALRAILEAQARARGALLVVEDADLAPPDAQRWIEGLDGVPRLAVVVTCTGSGPAARRTVTARPLTRAEVTTLVSHMLGTPSPPPGLDAALHAASGGMPGLAVALLREQVARSACRPDGPGEDGTTRWSWDRGAALVPGDDTARAFLRAMEQLPHETRRLVQVVAVAGEPVPLPVLLAAAGGGEGGLAPALRGGVVERRDAADEAWIAMRRAVTGALVLHGVADTERPRIHAALADAAGRRPAGRWETRFVATHDALARPDPARLARQVDVGAQLLAEGHPDDALAALAAHPFATAPLATGARRAIVRADALRVLGRFAEAGAAVHAGHGLAQGDEALVDEATLVNAHLQLDAGAMIDPATRDWVVALASHGERRAMVMVAELLLRAGDLDGALAWADAVSGGGALLDSFGAEADLVSARARVRRGDAENQGRAYAARLAEALANTDRRRAVDARCVEVEAALQGGALAHALDALHAAHLLLAAHASGGGPAMPWRVGRVAVWEASVRIAAGALPEAEGLLRAHAACGDAGAPWSVAREWQIAHARVRLASEDTPAALAALLRAADAARRAGDSPMAALHAGVAAAFATKADEVTDAVAQLRAVGDLRALATLLVHAGRVGRDPDLLRAAVDTARRTGDPVLLRDALRAAGDRDEARRVAATLARGLTGPLAAHLERHPGV